MLQLTFEVSHIHARVASASRSIVPVLLDAGRAHSAKPLQELLFELDAKEQEMVEFTKENFAALLATIGNCL